MSKDREENIKKSVIGWMNKEDFELYDIMFQKDGVTHADIFEHDPEVDPNDYPPDFPIRYQRVRVTLEIIKEKS